MDRNIDAFLAVARCKTLTEASNFLNLTQPSVSKRIAKLEVELKANLFHRNRRGMTLSAEGEAFLEHAKHIENEYRQGAEVVATIASAGLSLMRVGAGPLFQLNCIASLFNQLRVSFPALQLELITNPDQKTSQLISEGRMDIYLGIIPKTLLDQSIHFQKLISVEQGIVLRKDDPNTSQASINPTDVAHYNWVSFVADSGTEKRIKDTVFQSVQKKLEIDIRTTSFATGVELVKRGNFFMTAPLQLKQIFENEGLAVRPTQPRMPKRDAGIYVRKSAMGYTAIKFVIGHIEKSKFLVQLSN